MWLITSRSLYAETISYFELKLRRWITDSVEKQFWTKKYGFDQKNVVNLSNFTFVPFWAYTCLVNSNQLQIENMD